MRPSIALSGKSLGHAIRMRIVEDPTAVPPDDTLRMPQLQLTSLLGRAREGDDPVFLLVRRRAPRLASQVFPRPALTTSSVSIVLFVALILGTVLLWALR
jgi:hypothetical protein